MIFSYKLNHDYGLAPNPFHGYCTLAVCKSDIRRNKRLKIGDWIIGTGSVAMNNLGKIIYAMKLEEKLTFEQYWNDDRFISKKPKVNGSLVQMHGDNIYFKDAETNEWGQLNSAHSLSDGKVNKGHLIRDTGGNNVLISKTFYYFGDQALTIPNELEEICSQGRNYKSVSIPDETGDRLINWITSNWDIGIHGDPCNWKEYLNR